MQCEHSIHGGTNEEAPCVLMRRYACMALTNLTFGDSGNKALLCSFKNFMLALVAQLQSSSDELRQVIINSSFGSIYVKMSRTKEIIKN